MTDLRVHVCEAVIGNDLGRVEILEFGRVRSGLFGEPDEQFSAIQITMSAMKYVG